jgi:hypothetical protein
VHRGILLIVLALAAALAGAPAASALPANPWTGRWLDNNGSVLTLTQNGSQISGTQPCPGTTTLPGVNINGTASPDNRTATFTYTSSVCTGTGGTFSGTMTDDGLRVTGTGVTQFGTGFGFSWTYQSGGTEPRTTPPTTTTPGAREQCAGGIWSGRWSARGANVFTYVQNGSTLTGTVTGREDVIRGTISGNTVRGTFTIAEGTGTFVLTMAADGRSYTYTGTTTTGAPDEPFTSRFLGCAPGTAPPAPAGPDLGTTIPNPQTVTNGPTTLVAPGTISLRSLRRSKCVLVKAASRRPARVLVSIFSGRRSIRLFGQKLVIFFVPGSRQVCIPVPFRAHTFNVRTPLRVALGYTAGPRRQRTGRKPPPVIRPIKLVP